MFLLNKSLIHIDLSHNSFCYEAGLIMQEGLRLNHTLLGLHMNGNHFNIDANGFIQPSHSEASTAHVFTRITPDLTS